RLCQLLELLQTGGELHAPSSEPVGPRRDRLELIALFDIDRRFMRLPVPPVESRTTLRFDLNESLRLPSPRVRAICTPRGPTILPNSARQSRWSSHPRTLRDRARGFSRCA